MCLYPKLIFNRKYTKNKKNGGIIPPVTDERVLQVPVGCGQCIECKRQKARAWQIRLQEEIRTNTKAQFVTLTFSTESLIELKQELPNVEGYELDNAIATLAVRRFLERWRKKHKTSVKHWLVTELGKGRYEHIHLHGLIFTQDKQAIEQHWQYGFIWIGKYVNEKTINYISKYITKSDPKHPNYNTKILTSPGIGANYINRPDALTNQFKKKTKTDETYTTRQGTRLNLPIYYRNKIYTEEQREKLWLQKLDKEERYILGQKISIKNNDYTKYDTVLKTAQAHNQQLGYGNGETTWHQIEYEHERRKLIHKQRLDGPK